MRRLAIALMALCLMRLWLMPLPSSFWVDEMGTSFVVRHGAGDPSLRAAPQVPASLYYVLPRAVEPWFGSSEIAYRIPSLLALGLALLLIARIAARLIHPDAGWLAAFACLSLRGFNYQAADARPYALATLVFSAALWLLIRWLDSARWRDALLFVLAASLLWRVHLILWPMYLVLAVYAGTRVARRETTVPWTRAAGVFALLGVSLLPVLFEALALYREAGAHVIVPVPSIGELGHSLKLGLVAGFCAGAALLARWRRWTGAQLPAIGGIAAVLAWWLCDPLALYGFSWLTGASVFVPRYYSVALPGAALAAVVAASAFVPGRLWKPLGAAAGVGVFLFLGQWSHLWPRHHNSDWRAAASRLNQESVRAEMPVLCPSPFVEARPPVWRPGAPASGFLYSHLSVYRLRAREIAFPFEMSPQAEQYAASLASQTLAQAARFALYGGDRAVHNWSEWLSGRPELAGWRQRRLGPFGDVEVVIFEKTD